MNSSETETAGGETAETKRLWVAPGVRDIRAGSAEGASGNAAADFTLNTS